VRQKDFHENYTHGEIEPPSERSTGLTFAAFAAIVALIWRQSPPVPWVATFIAAGLTAISLTAPGILKPLNILWFKFGQLLHRLVSPIVMFAVFVLVFVPAGIIMRFWRDPLRSRRTTTSSYWIDCRTDSGTSDSMTNQF
jgi:hypothetical protein